MFRCLAPSTTLLKIGIATSIVLYTSSLCASYSKDTYHPHVSTLETSPMEIVKTVKTTNEWIEKHFSGVQSYTLFSKLIDSPNTNTTVIKTFLETVIDIRKLVFYDRSNDREIILKLCESKYAADVELLLPYIEATNWNGSYVKALAYNCAVSDELFTKHILPHVEELNICYRRYVSPERLIPILKRSGWKTYDVQRLIDCDKYSREDVCAILAECPPSTISELVAHRHMFEFWKLPDDVLVYAFKSQYFITSTQLNRLSLDQYRMMIDVLFTNRRFYESPPHHSVIREICESNHITEDLIVIMLKNSTSKNKMVILQYCLNKVPIDQFKTLVNDQACPRITLLSRNMSDERYTILVDASTVEELRLIPSYLIDRLSQHMFNYIHAKIIK